MNDALLLTLTALFHEVRKRNMRFVPDKDLAVFFHDRLEEQGEWHEHVEAYR